MESPGKVAVVGGSIAGTATAIAAHRAGYDVTLFERSSSDLAERGFGICIPEPLLEQCLAGGYLDAQMPILPITDRVWMTRQADSAAPKVLWRQHSRMISLNWGLLWQSLRRNMPADAFRLGQAVTRLSHDDTGVTVELNGSDTERFDFVIGGDGYRSIVRNAIAPDTVPDHAGYVTWRGVVSTTDVKDCDEAVELLQDAAATCGFDGGHSIFYLIPDGLGGHRINWLVYTAPPGGVDVGMSMSYASETELNNLTGAFEELVEARLPADWAGIVRQTPASAKAFQPIFDLKLARSAQAPYLLAGDASTITRPHTASGATKALQDALCLEKELREQPDWRKALDAYDAGRNAAGNDLVDLGRRLGRDQVEATPDWLNMDADSMLRWTQGSVAGAKLYIYTDPAD